MSEFARARVEERLLKLRLGAVAQRLDAILSAAARSEPTYLDFLDQLLAEETEASRRSVSPMDIQIAHFPAIKTLEEFEFKFQPSLAGQPALRARQLAPHHQPDHHAVGVTSSATR